MVWVMGWARALTTNFFIGACLVCVSPHAGHDAPFFNCTLLFFFWAVIPIFIITFYLKLCCIHIWTLLLKKITLTQKQKHYFYLFIYVFIYIKRVKYCLEIVCLEVAETLQRSSFFLLKNGRNFPLHSGIICLE